MTYEKLNTREKFAVINHDNDGTTLQRVTKVSPGDRSALQHQSSLGKATSEQKGAVGGKRHRMTAVIKVIGAVKDETGNELVIYVSCRVNGVLIHSLVDTGSIISIMHKHVFDECCAECNITLSSPPNGNLRGIDHGKMRILGVAKNMPIQLCNANGKGERITVSDDFLICEGVAVDCMMGTRFQQKYRAQIDAEKRILTLNNGVTISKHALVKK